MGWYENSPTIILYRIGKDHNVLEKKQWTMSHNQGEEGHGGTRTYVLENGAIISRDYGFTYYIDEDRPEGNIPLSDRESYTRLSVQSKWIRSCPIAFRASNNKTYLGILSGKDGSGYAKYHRAPLIDGKPDWSQLKNQTMNGAEWGYSCGIDSNSGTLFSSYAGKTVHTMDFNNNKLKSTKPNKMYAMSVDNKGNVLSVDGGYAAAFEPEGKTVYVTWRHKSQIAVYERDCFVAQGTNCQNGQVIERPMGFDPGPVSALKDGSVAAMDRGNKSVLILWLDDPENPKSNLNVKKIDDLPADPYMYNDFTGATLFSTHSENNFSFKGLPTFEDGSKVIRLGLTWDTKSGQEKPFNNLQLLARCYKSGNQAGKYEVVANVRPARKFTPLGVSSCIPKNIDTVEIKIKQLNDGGELEDVRKIQVLVYQ